MHLLALSPFLHPATIALLALGLAVLAIVVGYHGWRLGQERWRAHHSPHPLDRRHCKYCRWGEARLTQESLRVDQDDLVETRCYACSRCGLPVWTVSRSPVLSRTR